MKQKAPDAPSPFPSEPLEGPFAALEWECRRWEQRELGIDPEVGVFYCEGASLIEGVSDQHGGIVLRVPWRIEENTEGDAGAPIVLRISSRQVEFVDLSAMEEIDPERAESAEFRKSMASDVIRQLSSVWWEGVRSCIRAHPGMLHQNQRNCAH
ncbi:hypothetical protein TK90_2671 (plasmid) [Thioalkalivibrio sp. K90mix]|uniref:hypothetical protein n=1 Tax=Thioalkalivibrio sp. (strain K90mix) TaxID=396595 RepID=UPI000195A3BC|nr:hypothetical protein [Thioalkalivibrio sp. K90mix]ADC73158.1 hypothetical protein TK90_2671 [Thioalkalivibrio sp. K90mix]